MKHFPRLLILYSLALGGFIITSQLVKADSQAMLTHHQSKIASTDVITAPGFDINADEAQYIDLSQQAEEKDHQEANLVQQTRVRVQGQTQQQADKCL